ncbi:ROK family protein [Leifsonia poae]|uniref:ROK family protein n=1 Tax=Leifsonia poae TaxID=110933 RepID=UPI003D66E961
MSVTADRIALAAVQIDADQVIFLAHDLAGAELLRASEHHGRPMGRPDAVLDVAARVLASAMQTLSVAGREVAGLTVVVLAPVVGEPPVVLADTDLGWGRVDVLAGLRARLPKLPTNTTLSSDAPAALAEADLLTGVRDVLYLKSNSGIGGAIIANGTLLQGAHSFAGAIGHVAVDHDGLLCECGQHGCLVTVAGPDAVLAQAGLDDVLEREGLTRALQVLVERVRSGDSAAVSAFATAAEWVARTIAILRMTVDPELVVLGGYWAELADIISEAAERRMRLAPTDSGVDSPAVVAGRLGPDAALLGALSLLRDALLADPLALADAH